MQSRFSPWNRSALTVILLAVGCMAPSSGSDAARPDAAAGRAPVTAPPGAPPYDEALGRRLAEALAARGPGYVPRTHHLTTDGTPLYTNRLILQTSPYLLQHAHNPVDWHPWGNEAFARARELDRPVILSIGYSTCHWCHVMERESFEDEEIARYMNENFVAIKVDREERPDIDNVYMAAVQAMTGRGGWPMTVLLTPDREPFFAGTYFPPRSGVRGARQGFWEILHKLEDMYRNNRDRVVAQAALASRQVAASLSGRPPEGVPGAGAIVDAVRSLAGAFDPINGGFSTDRKFPRPVTLQLLLRYHRRSGDPQALAMVETTLERMAHGGIHDQIGGGFHRYTVEPTWLVPHFEKMLYDNAQLAAVYLEAYQVTGREDFAGVVRRTLDYAAREMAAGDGGFHSATDADSPAPSGHDEEGWFFTWTPGEIRELLGEPLATRLIAWYGVTPQGNFEGRSILHTPQPLERVAARLKIKPADLADSVAQGSARLYEARAHRPPPITDTKVLTAWNGLLLSAFARAAQVLGEARYRDVAIRTARFLLYRCRKDDRLYRTWAEGRPGKPGVLSDYAFLAAGLLDLYETTHDPQWLEEAMALHRTLQQQFWDAEQGGFYMTAADAEKLLAREKPGYDGAEPSGNSVALLNLMRLHALTGRDEYRVMASKGLAAFGRTMSRNPTAVPLMLCALDYHLDRPKEIVLVTPGPATEAAPFLARLAERFVPNRVLVVADRQGDRERLERLIPLLEQRGTRDGKPTAYVCEGRVCKFPTTDPELFSRQIAEIAPYDGVKPAALQPASLPGPWEFDPDSNRHWNPGHRHWHDGPPPPAGERK
jgi:uncharacterized protein YyaL (SSP411 family)